MLVSQSPKPSNSPALPTCTVVSASRCRRWDPSMRAAFRCFVSLSHSLSPRSPLVLVPRHPFFSPPAIRLPLCPTKAFFATSEALERQRQENDGETEVGFDGAGLFPPAPAAEPFGEAVAAAERDGRAISSPMVEVRELEELPEQWRRSRIAWLCKELPAYKHSTLVRILNAQRKWINQEDATYVVVHCMRIRENDAAFRVYKWMIQQRWFHFEFALATKLADYLGKERKFTKCREMFDSIINQGRVPSESTFHTLTVAYLSAPIQGCLEEACTIYNRMIQLGGYRPRLSLHNSLFRALVGKPGGSSKHYLKQAEFIYHNLVTSDLEIHKDVYAGLIWLHSYQDVIDKERITALREEMRNAGIEESKDVLVSVMRAFSKEGDVKETESAWLKLLESGCNRPSQGLVYRMDVYAKIGEPMKSLEMFRATEQDIPVNAASYHKIIEIMTKAQEVDTAEKLMDEFVERGLKPPMPAFLFMMDMYLKLGMREKLEQTFMKCLTRCHPNRSIYNIYLESLVRYGDLEKAEKIFNEMHLNGIVGTSAQSCNLILGGYIASGEFVKAEKIYDMMCQKKYEIEPQFLEKLEYVLSLHRRVVKKPISMRLDKEQREILIGLLLGGLVIESDEQRRNHAIHFEFSEDSNVHALLKMHIHERFYEWLTPSSRQADGDNEIPCRFATISHTYFGFYVDQFWLKREPMVPKLVHRWLSPRVLAYWYMYGGLRTSAGDILLKLKGGNREDVERIVKTFQAKSLACRVKRKGRVFWIGFQGSNAVWLWRLIEPYVLENVKDLLAPNGGATRDSLEEGNSIDGFSTESDSDEQYSV